MPDLRRYVGAVWLICVAAHAAESEYIGSAVCALCHPREASAQAPSAHAHSLFRAADHPLAVSFAGAGWIKRAPAFQLRFQRTPGGQIRAQGFDDHHIINLPVEWALGAGGQAVTFVTRIDAQWHLEHHLSYYSALGRLAPTPGHGSLRATNLAEAMGLPYKTTDPATGILGCFECHSTGPVTVNSQGELLPRETGVRCEACHGAGSAHVAAARSGRTAAASVRQAIGNPKRLPAMALNEFCGRCHRPPASPGAQIDWNYPWNVRHQPVYLSNSRCFTQSKGELSCLTCHDPHNDSASRGVASANSRCRQCHEGGSAARPAPDCGEPAGANCVDCHMPRVSPEPALRFTNHWIGVYRSGSRLRPQ